MKRHLTTASLTLLACSLFLATAALAQNAQVVPATRHNSTTVGLAEMARSAPAPVQGGQAPYAIKNKFKFDHFNASEIEGGEDPVGQLFDGTLAPTVNWNFEGSSDADNDLFAGGRIVPPDTEGDVGPNHYVQWINLVAEVFDKTGTTLFGPAAGNVFFAGLGGICETTNDGDPIVLYDEGADRWLVSQFAVPGPTYSMCIAISQTPDPTGAYHQYEFSFGSDFPDYPKLGIWGDSYTMTTRDFRFGSSWAGMSAVALDRSALLNGIATNMVRFANAFNTINDGALPADADNLVSGPAIFGAHGNDADDTFELWELDVDWNNPGAATFISIPGVAIPVYDSSVPSATQPGPGEALDDLSFFTMHRLNVRDFGAHVSMVANHTVEFPSNSGTLAPRWYEFRNTGSNWALHQSGTYSPDSDDRWMGSIAINAAGDISLGYSRSSSTLFPSIYFTGQTADQSGTGVMNVAETRIIDGTGAQTGSLNRWGDYSMMSVDPTDDSFWYTTEYYAETNSFDFKTRVANLDLGDPVPPVSVHVENIVTSTQGVGSGNKVAVATVTLNTNQGTPAAGYTVTADFSGTIAENGVSGVTGSDGTVVLQTTNTAKGKVNVEVCVSDVADGLPYAEGDNTDPAYACVVVGPATDVHVEAIDAGSQGVGGGNKIGTATVTIRDNLGGAAVGYTVDGTFSGTFNGDVSGVTVSDGTVTFQAAGTARGKVNVDFCVTNVAGALPYDLNDNPSTAYDCSTAAPSAKRGTDVAGLNTIVDVYTLAQNYPNPFRGATLIDYVVEEGESVRITVFNLLGQEVANLVDGFQDAGRHTVAFDGAGLSGGLYLYVMEAGEYTDVKRMTLLK